VRISADGQHWTTVADTAASDDWLTYAVELPHVEVPVLLIRFLYVTADGTASDDGSVWAVRDVRIGSAQPANQR
jgi:hypothetical protein